MVVVSDDARIVATAKVGSSSALVVDERVRPAALGVLSIAHDECEGLVGRDAVVVDGGDGGGKLNAIRESFILDRGGRKADGKG